MHSYKWIYLRQSLRKKLSLSKNLIKPFVPSAPFLYPLKTSETHKVFWCFPGLEKGCIGNEWVKKFHSLFINNKLFFYKQHFFKQRQAEIGKNQAKAKQHPEAEL